MLLLWACLRSNGLPAFLLAEVAIASLLTDTPGPSALALRPAVATLNNGEPSVAPPSNLPAQPAAQGAPGAAQHIAPGPVAANQAIQQQSGGNASEALPLLSAARSEQLSSAGMAMSSGDLAAPAQEAVTQDLSAQPTAAPMPALVSITPQQNGGIGVPALPISAASSRQELPSSQSKAGPSSGSTAAPWQQVFTAPVPSGSQPGPALPLQPSPVTASIAADPNQHAEQAPSQPPILQPATAEVQSAQPVATAASALVNVTAQRQSTGSPVSPSPAASRPALLSPPEPEPLNSSATSPAQQVFAAMPSTSQPGPALPLEPMTDSSAKIAVQAASVPASNELAGPEGRAPAASAIKSAQQQNAGNDPPQATPLPILPRQDQSGSMQAAAAATSTAVPIQEAIANVGSLQGASVQQSSSAGLNITPSTNQQQSGGKPSPATALPAVRPQQAASASEAASWNASAAVSPTAASQEAARAQPVSQMPPAAQQDQSGGSAVPLPMPMRRSPQAAPVQPLPESAAVAPPEAVAKGAQAAATTSPLGPAQQLTGGKLAPATPVPSARPDHPGAVDTAALSGALATSTAATATVPQVQVAPLGASPAAAPPPIQQQSGGGVDSPAVPVPVVRHEHIDSANAPQASDAPPTSTAAPTKHKGVKSDQGLLFILVTLFITIAIICLWHSDETPKMYSRLQPRRQPLTISPAVRRSSQTGARRPPRDTD